MTREKVKISKDLTGVESHPVQRTQGMGTRGVRYSPSRESPSRETHDLLVMGGNRRIRRSHSRAWCSSREGLPGEMDSLSPGGNSRAGSRTRKVVPCPGRHSKLRVPPCF